MQEVMKKGAVELRGAAGKVPASSSRRRSLEIMSKAVKGGARRWLEARSRAASARNVDHECTDPLIDEMQDVDTAMPQGVNAKGRAKPAGGSGGD